MFTSFARRGQRRAFWQSNQQKKDSKGSEEGERAGRGHAFGGGGRGHLKGKRTVFRRSLGKEDGGRGERCPSPGMKKRTRRTRNRRKDRRERSRALSCRPGSQIRRGLRSGVDCV